MEPILAHAHGLIYTLLDLMPTPHQRDSLPALLGLFLQAQGHPLPQSSKARSPSALSRFLNGYPWSTQQLIRTTARGSVADRSTDGSRANPGGATFGTPSPVASHR